MEQKNAMTIGIPRAMLYYRFGTMWRTFFDELHIPTVISPPTTRETLEIGSRIAVDETCLSAKLFMGHVHTLLGKCEAIFIPRYSNLDHDALFCTRFEGLYDQTRNVFRSQPQRFISCNIDKNGKSPEAAAFEALGKALGAPPPGEQDRVRRGVQGRSASAEAMDPGAGGAFPERPDQNSSGGPQLCAVRSVSPKADPGLSYGKRGGLPACRSDGPRKGEKGLRRVFAHLPLDHERGTERGAVHLRQNKSAS